MIAQNILPGEGKKVTITISNKNSPVKTGPLASVCPDTLDIVGVMASKPRTDKDPLNFSILVAGSPVPLRVIDFRLVLAVNGVEVIPPKTPLKKQSFIVKGSKGAEYSVTFDGSNWYCNCPARKECKHIVSMKEQHG